MVNMFTAFGYFDDDADDQRVIDGAADGAQAGRPTAAGPSEQGLGCRKLCAERVTGGSRRDDLSRNAETSTRWLDATTWSSRSPLRTVR